jgi:hypothetical protein
MGLFDLHGFFAIELNKVTMLQCFCSMGDRLMVGQRTLDASILVRIQVPQPIYIHCYNIVKPFLNK